MHVTTPGFQELTMKVLNLLCNPRSYQCCALPLKAQPHVLDISADHNQQHEELGFSKTIPAPNHNGMPQIKKKSLQFIFTLSLR